MKFILKTILSFFLLFSLTTFAQQRVALHHNGNTTIFSSTSPFVDAYNASAIGDTIYLSGGVFDAPTTIDKGIFVLGAGFHVDSTTATYQTLISTSVNIGENADGLHLEGLLFQYSVATSNNISFSNSQFSRCYFNGALNITGNSGNFTENLAISECIFKSSLNIQNTENCFFTNNILEAQIGYTTNNIYKNNVFLRNTGSYSSASGRMIYYANNNVFENNVIYNATIYCFEGSGNVFQRNLFSVANPEMGASPISVNNYFGVPQAAIFLNQVGFTWLTTNNNHLQDPVTYFGTDGNEVGIHGGLFPFKPGAVPTNPHIQFKNISSQTNNNGDLNIQLKVNAQDN